MTDKPRTLEHTATPIPVPTQPPCLFSMTKIDAPSLSPERIQLLNDAVEAKLPNAPARRAAAHAPLVVFDPLTIPKLCAWVLEQKGPGGENDEYGRVARSVASKTLASWITCAYWPDYIGTNSVGVAFWQADYDNNTIVRGATTHDKNIAHNDDAPPTQTALRAVSGYSVSWDYALALMVYVLKVRRAARANPELLATIPYVDWRLVHTMRTTLERALGQQCYAVTGQPVHALRWEPVSLPETSTGELVSYPEHYLHLSKDSKEGALLWAYTENPAKGEADIQTPIKPGKYLQKFYPHLGHDEITKLVNLINGGATTPEILFAKTPEEVVDVYRRGPWSCMHYSADRFDTPERPGAHELGSSRGEAEETQKDAWGNPVGCSMHPVEVYGTLPGATWDTNPRDCTDLQLAYWVECDPKNRYTQTITARALVWPEKKFYGRVYGGSKDRSGENNAGNGADNIAIKDRFIKALEALGYTSPKGWNSLDGARIRKVVISGQLDRGNLKLVMPYIDGDNHQFDLTSTHVKIINRLGDHSFTEDATCGVWDQYTEENRESDEPEYDYTCDNCGEGCNDTRTVYRLRSGRRNADELSYCDGCCDDVARCDHTENLWDNDLVEVVVRIDWAANGEDNPITQEWNPVAVRDETWHCDYTNLQVSDELEKVCVHVLGPNGLIAQTWAAEIAERKAVFVSYPNPAENQRVWYNSVDTMPADVRELWQSQQSPATQAPAAQAAE